MLDDSKDSRRLLGSPAPNLCVRVQFSYHLRVVQKQAIHQSSDGEKIHVYIYFLGTFGNLATLGSRMSGKWKLGGERTA